jgi:hypothetical protein
MDDFANAIAFEVKQEIADRYFGMRTRIETRARQYLEQLHHVDKVLTETISFDLWRMRALFPAPQHFHSFLTLIDLPGEDAIDLCRRLTPPPGKEELFRHLRGGGLTRRQRFRSLTTAVYCSLAKNIAAYNETARLLEEEHQEICAEIERFRRQNDITDILSFLRTLDCDDADRRKHLHSSGTLQQNISLEKELRLVPPPAATTVLLPLRLLPPLSFIKNSFNTLLHEAYVREAST